MGNYEFSNPPYGHHIMTGKIHYESNDEIQWENIVNEKLLEFLETLYFCKDWQLCMYNKYIPEQIIKKYFNDIDILCMLEYGNPDEHLLESISYLFNILHWRYVFMKPHTAEFIDKFSNNVDFECIAIDNRLPEWFIDKYKDKLFWEDICMFQQLSIDFIENHLSYLTDTCWQYLLKFQKSVSDNVNFIIKYAEKLKEN